MKFKPEQHFRMADLLSDKALFEEDLAKRKRIEAMARVFRRLAVRAYMLHDLSMRPRDWSAFKADSSPLGFIETPTPWDELEEWEIYLGMLEKLPPSKMLRDLIEQAEEIIVRKKLGLVR